MVTRKQVLSAARRTAITAAYRTETGLRDLFASGAAKRGWTPAVLPYSGYGGEHRARVLGRVVLAPASVDPAARRGIPGWRRLITLECPAADAEVEFAGARTTVTSDSSGLVDTTITVDSTPAPGIVQALIHVAGRGPVPAHVHVAAPDSRLGIVCDIDDTVWLTGITQPRKAAWRTLTGSSSTRQSVPGMARLLRATVEPQQHPAVVYLSNGPWNLAGAVSRFLQRNDFPSGALLMTDWGITPRRWFRDGRAHKSSALERLAHDMPGIRWVLIGDDGEHDPDIYTDFARSHPDRVAAIALRQVRPGRTTRRSPMARAVRASSGSAQYLSYVGPTAKNSFRACSPPSTQARSAKTSDRTGRRSDSIADDTRRTGAGLAAPLIAGLGLIS